MKTRTIIALFLAITLTGLESQTFTGYDIFLHDLSSAQVFQATDTPGIAEMLSDVVARSNGVNRSFMRYRAEVPSTFGDSRFNSTTPSLMI